VRFFRRGTLTDVPNYVIGFDFGCETTNTRSPSK
jgi:hypothetical protein